jgi:hypothetical protein
MSSWPTAQSPSQLLDTMRAFIATGRHLAGLSGHGHNRTALTGPIGVVEGRGRGRS